MRVIILSIEVEGDDNKEVLSPNFSGVDGKILFPT